MPNKEILTSRDGKQSRFFYGYIILFSAFIILMIVAGALCSFGVFLKPVLNEFGWSRAAVSSAYSLNMLLGGFVGILAGKISDRFSPKVALTIGGVLMGVGYLLMGQVNSIWQIYLFYGVLVSIGSGFIPIPLLSLVARWFIKRRGLASGIVMAGVGVGLIVVPPLANQIISSYDWRISFKVLALIAFVLTVVFAQFMKRAPVHGNLSLDVDSPKKDHSYTNLESFSLREATRTLHFWTIIIMGLFFFFGIQTIIVHVAAYATDIGFSSTAAAGILSVIGLVNIGGTIGIGSLGDRIGPKNAIILIFALAAISFLGFRFFNELWMLYLWAVIFGLAYGGFCAMQSPLTAEYFGLKNLGLILSFFMMAQNVGGAVGPLVAGSIFDISGNYMWAFLICAILSLISLILSIMLKKVKGSKI